MFNRKYDIFDPGPFSIAMLVTEVYPDKTGWEFIPYKPKQPVSCIAQVITNATKLNP